MRRHAWISVLLAVLGVLLPCSTAHPFSRPSALAGRDATPAAVAISAPCTSLKKRREWHTLSDGDKRAYLDAELCLMKTPAALGLRGARTRFDELQSVHIFQAEIAHFVGQFFPFHRLFMHAHETLLEQVCGYKAGQPYWNESLDAGSFSSSIVLSPELGFGGSGVGTSQCIATGPFANYTNSLGPSYRIADHCIQRAVSDVFSTFSAQGMVDNCTVHTNYVDFWHCVEAGPHGGGHAGIGAQMLNPISSPGDPLFYMHHTWLDRIWAVWQDQDKSGGRLSEIGGNNRIDPNSPKGPPPGVTPPAGLPGAGSGPPAGFGPLGPLSEPRPADVPEPQVIGDPAGTVTLTHLLQMYGIVPNRTVAEVMDTRGFMCYEYD